MYYRVDDKVSKNNIVENYETESQVGVIFLAGSQFLVAFSMLIVIAKTYRDTGRINSVVMVAGVAFIACSFMGIVLLYK